MFQFELDNALLNVNKNLNRQIGELISLKKCSISVAESITAGLLFNALSSIEQLKSYCIGGVVDFGPIIGMRVHRYASTFFRSTLWCPLPPGILNYNESNNTFSIDYKFLDMFYQTFFRIIPNWETFKKSFP